MRRIADECKECKWNARAEKEEKKKEWRGGKKYMEPLSDLILWGMSIRWPYTVYTEKASECHLMWLIQVSFTINYEEVTKKCRQLVRKWE